jgi:hypothetical protein
MSSWSSGLTVVLENVDCWGIIGDYCYDVIVKEMWAFPFKKWVDFSCKGEFQSTYRNIVRFTTMCYLSVLSMFWGFDWVRDYLWGLGWLIA